MRRCNWIRPGIRPAASFPLRVATGLGMVGALRLATAATAAELPPGVPEDGTALVRLDGTGARATALVRRGRIRRLYGPAFAGGADARATAEAFLAAGAALLGAERGDLVPAAPVEGGRAVQPVWYDPATGTYRFTALTYRQQRGGIPVFRSRLTLLVGNGAGHPLVLVSSDLRDLAAFDPAAPAAVEADPAAAVRAVAARRPGLTAFTVPRPVIFAGVDGSPAAPRLAWTLIGSRPAAGGAETQRWRFVTDARSGAVLDEEDLVLEVDLLGNASGRATEGQGADICGPAPMTPLPFIRIDAAAGVAFTDESGDYVLPDVGSNPIVVKAQMRGEWFRLVNESEEQTLFVQTVTPPGPADFVYNAENDDEFRRAEVNAYLHANVARSYALRFNPEYPVIADQREFRVNVNRDLNCNATYTGTAVNFYTSGGGCPNTGFSSVVYHEYGHHLVASGGSGQGAYGEGMADTISVLVHDDPGLAYGFTGNCNQPLRNADNNCRYRASGCSTCGGEIHACGQVLSGCVWSLRNELIGPYPDTYRDILSVLTINSILLHTGSAITPAITVDFLTLDDDNGNIFDGTPHYDQIAAAFAVHDMDAPPLMCPADLDGSGTVEFGDILAILAAWGPCQECPEDLDGSGAVDFADVLFVLASWGPCPE